MPQVDLRPVAGGKSGAVTLDKDDLREAGFVDENGEVEHGSVLYERTGTGEFKLKLLDDSGQPVARSD